MVSLILFNKPYGVVCQFSVHAKHPTLAAYIEAPGFYAAGRLDSDSEGLLLLTNSGRLQYQICDPRYKFPKTYFAQLEGEIDCAAIRQLERGVALRDGVTAPARVERIAPPTLWSRDPPIRVRHTIPDSWVSLTLTEGKNRQARRMTACVGYPTLRLIRVAIGQWNLGGLQPGQSRLLSLGTYP